MEEHKDINGEPLLLAVDTYYHDGFARTVGVTFDWNDAQPMEVYTDELRKVEDYVPGQFYKRELPCILQLLKTIDLSKIESIIVDGHVYIDNDHGLGLGGHLWEALGSKIPIIGVAKRSFHHTEKVSEKVFRGKSRNPLHVSAIGMELEEAAARIQQMKGDHRTPAVLKKLDQLTRQK